MINQKNYYTEYMKRDDQILPLRLQAEANRDRMIRSAKDRDRERNALANMVDAMDHSNISDEPFVDQPGNLSENRISRLSPENPQEGIPGEGSDASKTIVIHLGSQNMRIGFASDALPKTVPMAVGQQWSYTESENRDPLPKREDLSSTPEQQFGDEFSKKYTKQCNDLKIDMRANKRKVLPNSKDLVINFNRRAPPEKIPEHNDPVRIEWTETKGETIFAGHQALRIPDDSDPKFKVASTIHHGWFNERDYRSAEAVVDALCYCIEEALRNELGFESSTDWRSYSVIFVIPDLYEKAYVQALLDQSMRELEFSRVCFMQESLAASFGAGYSTACIVDVGAQKTSICCVEDGMCIDDSRINLKYGGYDVTEVFMKMMLHDHFPYQEINLRRRYDFLLAEELKIKFCTMSQANISVQLYDFHLRTPGQPTRKYQFKTYDEVILAPMGFYDPSIFDHSSKLENRRKLFKRSYNAYEPEIPDDPVSAAQVAILTSIKPSLGVSNTAPPNIEVSTPVKEKPQPFNLLSRIDSDILGNNGTPGTSKAGSPAPDGVNTPNNHLSSQANGGSPGPNTMFQFGGGSPAPPTNIFVKTAEEIAIERDSVLPIAPLDTAIITSIQHAAKGDEKRIRDLFGGIMVIGGGAKTPGFGPFLEERLKARRPDLADKILVGTSPREMDGQVVAWKGASVFGKLPGNDAWITPAEYKIHGSRIIYFKVAFNY